MELLHPGVYIQEVSSGVRPIEGASTSTAAFIGPAERGSLNRAHMVTSFTEFQTVYGGFLPDSWLAHSALQFFNNGGRRLYIVRVAKGAETASVSLADRQGQLAKTFTIAANSPGKWGNTLVVDVANGAQDPNDEFKLTVKREISTQPLVTELLETYDNLSMNPEAVNFVEKVVNAKSKFVRVTAEPNDSTTKGFSRSGTGPQTSLPSGNRNLLIDVNGDGPQLITLAEPLTDGSQIAAAIKTAVGNLSPLRGSTDPLAFDSFDAQFANNLYTLTSGVGGKRSSVQVLDAPTGNAAGLLKLGRTRGEEQTGAGVLRPASGSNYLVGDSTVTGNVVAATAGSDGVTPQENDYQKGFALLDVVRDVNIIAVPGIGSTTMVDFGASYCDRRGDCFFIGDMSITDDTKEDAQAFVAGLQFKSSYAAVYFPWLKAIDPTGASAEPIVVPLSGYLAGLYARTDARRGVWKAPAGTEANVAGAVGLLKDITDAEQDTLNPIGANVIRTFPASGMVVWGARTLGGAEWRYIPVRRTAIFLEQSIYNGIQWAVFEPNDEGLWSSLRLNINAFMMLQFRAGAFQGRSANEAFFVQCDNKTTTQADIDAGRVNILVGFAPLKPAEFVVLRLSQKAGQSAA
ncbi:MAG TPA: phage tail sheath subtilisin-like domain-containing protein [Pyrinomonadaceae bacterium]|nr:phage tail sheath subtilisin-like domain-containing protein [Pyrinomonadaceae bacterium]